MHTFLESFRQEARENGLLVSKLAVGMKPTGVRVPTQKGIRGFFINFHL